MLYWYFRVISYISLVLVLIFAGVTPLDKPLHFLLVLMIVIVIEGNSLMRNRWRELSQKE